MPDVSEENYISINFHIKVGFKKDSIIENIDGKNQVRFIKKL